jgi:hypothetical protein
MSVKVVEEFFPEILFQLLKSSTFDSTRRLKNPRAVSTAPTGKNVVFYPQQFGNRNFLGPRIHSLGLRGLGEKVSPLSLIMTWPISGGSAVRYVSRVRQDGERIYNGGFHDPVFVAFDLFTLTADRVTYDQSSRTLLAAGDVMTTNGTRPRTHANSMKFRIAYDRVLRLP